METFLELAKRRYSVRNYLDKPVEEEKLHYVLEAGRIAPSAANYQPWHFIVIRNSEARKMIAETYNRPWLLQAPVIIVVCGDHKIGWKRADGKDHTDIDIAITVDHMTLAAEEMELGTCWICNFNAKRAIELLNLPEHIEPIVYLPLGYPGKEPDNRDRHLIRKKPDEIIHWEKF
ncbi:MAG: nitroreductase family protein [Bacteroidetes bacterium]|nr:nitroreductase family protein [Bacteroidota bacterium]